MIKRDPDQANEGYISIATYCDKYMVSKEVLNRLVKTKQLKTFRTIASGGIGESRFVEGKFVFAVGGDKRYRDGKKICSGCNSWLGEEHYRPSEWKRAKSPCAVCSRSSMERLRGTRNPNIDALIIASNREAEIDRRLMSEYARAEHEQRIAQHAAKVEADGEAGDGKDWRQ